MPDNLEQPTKPYIPTPAQMPTPEDLEASRQADIAEQRNREWKTGYSISDTLNAFIRGTKNLFSGPAEVVTGVQKAFQATQIPKLIPGWNESISRMNDAISRTYEVENPNFGDTIMRTVSTLGTYAAIPHSSTSKAGAISNLFKVDASSATFAATRMGDIYDTVDKMYPDMPQSEKVLRGIFGGLSTLPMAKLYTGLGLGNITTAGSAIQKMLSAGFAGEYLNLTQNVATGRPYFENLGASLETLPLASLIASYMHPSPTMSDMFSQQKAVGHPLYNIKIGATLSELLSREPEATTKYSEFSNMVADVTKEYPNDPKMREDMIIFNTFEKFNVDEVGDENVKRVLEQELGHKVTFLEELDATSDKNISPIIKNYSLDFSDALFVHTKTPFRYNSKAGAAIFCAPTKESLRQELITNNLPHKDYEGGEPLIEKLLKNFKPNQPIVFVVTPLFANKPFIESMLIHEYAHKLQLNPEYLMKQFAGKDMNREEYTDFIKMSRDIFERGETQEYLVDEIWAYSYSKMRRNPKEFMLKFPREYAAVKSVETGAKATENISSTKWFEAHKKKTWADVGVTKQEDIDYYESKGLKPNDMRTIESLKPKEKILTGYRGTVGESFIGGGPATEGEGIYLSTNLDISGYVGKKGKIWKVKYKQPKNPLIVKDKDPLPLLDMDPIMFEPIKSSDSEWIKFNKQAVINTKQKNDASFDLSIVAKELTKLIKEKGYDAVSVRKANNIEVWDVLLDNKLLISKEIIETQKPSEQLLEKTRDVLRKEKEVLRPKVELTLEERKNVNVEDIIHAKKVLERVKRKHTEKITFYHLTTKERWENIKIEGLLSDKNYFSLRLKDLGYAVPAVEKKPHILLTIDIPKEYYDFIRIDPENPNWNYIVRTIPKEFIKKADIYLWDAENESYSIKPLLKQKPSEQLLEKTRETLKLEKQSITQLEEGKKQPISKTTDIDMIVKDLVEAGTSFKDILSNPELTSEERTKIQEEQQKTFQAKIAELREVLSPEDFQLAISRAGDIIVAGEETLIGRLADKLKKPTEELTEKEVGKLETEPETKLKRVPPLTEQEETNFKTKILKMPLALSSRVLKLSAKLRGAKWEQASFKRQVIQIPVEQLSEIITQFESLGERISNVALNKWAENKVNEYNESTDKTKFISDLRDYLVSQGRIPGITPSWINMEIYHQKQNPKYADILGLVEKYDKEHPIPKPEKVFPGKEEIDAKREKLITEADEKLSEDMETLAFLKSMDDAEKVRREQQGKEPPKKPPEVEQGLDDEHWWPTKQPTSIKSVALKAWDVLEEFFVKESKNVTSSISTLIKGSLKMHHLDFNQYYQDLVKFSQDVDASEHMQVILGLKEGKVLTERTQKQVAGARVFLDQMYRKLIQIQKISGRKITDLAPYIKEFLPGLYEETKEMMKIISTKHKSIFTFEQALSRGLHPETNLFRYLLEPYMKLEKLYSRLLMSQQLTSMSSDVVLNWNNIPERDLVGKRGWQAVKSQGLKHFNLKPEDARFIDNALGVYEKKSQLGMGFDKLTSLARLSIFIAPFIHAYNLTSHMFLRVPITKWPSFLGEVARKSTDDLVTNSPEYKEFTAERGVERGMGISKSVNEMVNILTNKSNRPMNRLWTLLNVSRPDKSVVEWYRASRDVLWTYENLAAYNLYQQLRSEGLEHKEAFKQMTLFMGDYSNLTIAERTTINRMPFIFYPWSKINAKIITEVATHPIKYRIAFVNGIAMFAIMGLLNDLLRYWTNDKVGFKARGVVGFIESLVKDVRFDKGVGGVVKGVTSGGQNYFISHMRPEIKLAYELASGRGFGGVYSVKWWEALSKFIAPVGMATRALQGKTEAWKEEVRLLGLSPSKGEPSSIFDKYFKKYFEKSNTEPTQGVRAWPR